MATVHARRRVPAVRLIAPLSLAVLTLTALPFAAVPAANGTQARHTSSGTEETILSETFDSEASMTKHGWSVAKTDVVGMREGWQGWSNHTLDDVVQTWGADGNRGDFSRADGGIAVVASDGNRPAAATFSSALVSPSTPIPNGTEALEARFDSHYRQGQAPQTARLVAVFDRGGEQVARNFSKDDLDAEITSNVDVPKGATSVQWRWEYKDSSNNWYWMVDNVSVRTAQPQPREITVTSGAKPVAAPSEKVTLKLSGLRQGTRITAEFDQKGVGSKVTSARAAADGTTQVTTRISSRAGTGQHTLRLSGDGAVARDVPVTVLTRVDVDRLTSTQPLVASETFESGRAPASSRPWEYLSVPEIYAEYGLERRQAFTRGSGRVAHIDAGAAPAQARLNLRNVTLPKDHDGLELRFDSHFLAGQQAGQAQVVLDYGAAGTVVLSPFDASTSHESSQMSLPLDIPTKAKRVKIGFSFSAQAGGGSWSVDNVELAKGLPALADDAEPTDVVDIISDVQGDGPNLTMRDTVLPGLASMRPTASTLVANGDLVNSGDEAAYTKYFDALKAGKGEYKQVISVIGNHEYYGSSGPEYYQNLWLRMTRMGGIGGQGGLWGEQVLPGGVPVLWIGSEGYDYREHHGDGPFVKISDRQFNWLASRLEYYRESGTPVMLFSHHPFPNTVSGTYAEFYADDYGDDAARMTRLLSQNPNASLFTAHTHWDVRDADWDGNLRDDPSATLAPTVFNTGSITTAYGPSGDWGDAPKGSGNPVAVRADVYQDRVRVVAYEFVDGAPKEIKHRDVPLVTAER